jgi:hypothetical protein
MTTKIESRPINTGSPQNLGTFGECGFPKKNGSLIILFLIGIPSSKKSLIGKSKFNKVKTNSGGDINQQEASHSKRPIYWPQCLTSTNLKISRSKKIHKNFGPKY